MTSITTIFIVLSACASITVAKPTQELSATVGGETNITCLFEDGTLRNIYWYFNTAQSWQRILTLAKGDLTVAPPYIGRATLQNGNNTLSLKGITVADEGTYRCDVDRQGQPAVLHIYSDLNIYSLRPSTLPVVSPCAMIGESAHCTAQANDTFSLTCTLFNVYPVKEAVLTWYQDGKSVSSTYGKTLEDNAITNLSLPIQVTQSRNLTCNATFESADGRQHTAVSVEAWIMAPSGMTDEPDPQNETLNGGEIAAIAICSFLGIVVVVIVMIFKFRLRKQNEDAGITDNTLEDEERGHLIYNTGNTNQEKEEESEATVSDDPESDSKHNENEERPKDAVSNDHKSDSKHNENEEPEASVSNDPESDSKHNEDEERPKDAVSNAHKSDSKHNENEERPKDAVSNDHKSDSKHNENEERPKDAVSNDHKSDSKHNENEEPEASVSNDHESDSKHNEAKMSSATKRDFDGTLKLIAKAMHKKVEVDDLGSALGFDPADIGRYTDENEKQGGNHMGTLDMLRTWQKRQTASTEKQKLKSALVEAGQTSLADKYLSTPEVGSKPQISPPEALGAANSNDKMSTTTTNPPRAMSTSLGKDYKSSERRVTDRQILKLSKQMPFDKLSEFCVALDLDITDAQNISSRHHLNSQATFEDVLKRWKGKTKGRMSELDDALREAECLDLIDRYKD